MKGLELSEKFFMEQGLPLLEKKFPHLLEHMTVGLVGQGSECLGFDDEISRDHDWGASFCIWLPEEIYAKEGKALQKVYEQLEVSSGGYPKRNTAAQGRGRTGVLETGAFYYSLIGCRGIPETNTEWLYAPETAYSCAANGKLFYSSGSAFEKIRAGLLQYYPEDIRLKKIAARAVTMAQAGQYNYIRCRKRKDQVAAVLSLSEFMKASCSMIHLLNRQYMPFYKWSYKSAEKQPILGNTAQRLCLLAKSPLAWENEGIIEQICIEVKEELRRQRLTDLDCDFLEPHGTEIMSRIEDMRIRTLPVLFG